MPVWDPLLLGLMCLCIYNLSQSTTSNMTNSYFMKNLKIEGPLDTVHNGCVCTMNYGYTAAQQSTTKTKVENESGWILTIFGRYYVTSQCFVKRLCVHSMKCYSSYLQAFMVRKTGLYAWLTFPAVTTIASLHLMCDTHKHTDVLAHALVRAHTQPHTDKWFHN